MKPIFYRESASFENWDEKAYLYSNPDVAKAVKCGDISSAWDHFYGVGHKEGRFLAFPNKIKSCKDQKKKWILPLIKSTLLKSDNKKTLNFLSDELIEQTGINQDGPISSHDYDQILAEMIILNPEWKILDVGCGLRNTYYPNVVNYEICPYDTTDVVGVGEKLPFNDNCFDLVISSAVLEHVIDPFKCSQELHRVAVKGGKIWCAVPFLQPYHGYPHHYYNMTFQGLTNLFSQNCDVQLLDTRPYALPIDVLKELLTKYMSVLPEAERSKFSKLRIRDISNSKDSELKEKSWVKNFPEWWNKYFCSVNTVIATKNSNK